MAKLAVTNVYPQAVAKKSGRWWYIFAGDKVLGAGKTAAIAWAKARLVLA